MSGQRWFGRCRLARRLELRPVAVTTQPSVGIWWRAWRNRRRGNDTHHHADTNAAGVILCRKEPSYSGDGGERGPSLRAKPLDLTIHVRCGDCGSCVRQVLKKGRLVMLGVGGAEPRCSAAPNIALDQAPAMLGIKPEA